MELSMRRWRPGHLLASWATYWVGLAGVAVGPAVPALWRATHLPKGHGTISAGFDNSLLTLSVVEDGVKTLSSSISFGAAMAWIIGPPLVLWLIWLALRSRAASDAAQSIEAGNRDRLAAGSDPATNWRVAREERVPVEREPVRTPNP
jgi:hypothetical protein